MSNSSLWLELIFQVYFFYPTHDIAHVSKLVLIILKACLGTRKWRSLKF
jgi:hypothetical protein